MPIVSSVNSVQRRAIGHLSRATNPHRTKVLWWDLGEIGLFGLGFLAYFLVRGAVVDREVDAFANAHRIIDLQSSLRLWVEPTFQTWVLETELLMRAMNFVYFWLDFPLIIATGLLLFWRSRPNYTLLRDALLISGAFALVVYWTFPVAPPRYLDEYGFVDTLEQFANLSYQAQSMAPFVNPFAAVPSLHVGWAALLAAVIFRATSNPLYRLAAVAALLAQSVAVIGTANHYLFDGVVGLAVCVPAYAIALWLQRSGYPRLHAAIARRADAQRTGEPAGASRRGALSREP